MRGLAVFADAWLDGWLMRDTLDRIRNLAVFDTSWLEGWPAEIVQTYRKQ